MGLGPFYTLRVEFDSTESLGGQPCFVPFLSQCCSALVFLNDFNHSVTLQKPLKVNNFTQDSFYRVRSVLSIFFTDVVKENSLSYYLNMPVDSILFPNLFCIIWALQDSKFFKTTVRNHHQMVDGGAPEKVLGWFFLSGFSPLSSHIRKTCTLSCFETD